MLILGLGPVVSLSGWFQSQNPYYPIEVLSLMKIPPVVRKVWLIIFPFLIGSLSPLYAEVLDPAYQQRQEALIQRLQQRGFSDQELSRLFSDSRVTLYPEIVERKGKGVDYLGSRFGLLSLKSLQQGKLTLETNKRILRTIENDYGVKGEVLIAILRVETNFGRYIGNHVVFNSLLTMTLIENRRSAWAEEELIHLLWLCRRENKDPLSLKGSWAGAFGIPQFVPSSYLKYAVDGNGDGRVDLHDLTDALASMANYLRAFGWSPEEPERKKEALFAYNRCHQYVEAVLTYARALSEH
ncbi:MAG: lytic murein transglycosylase [Thermodesulfobacteriota bacterium]